MAGGDRIRRDTYLGCRTNEHRRQRLSSKRLRKSETNLLLLIMLNFFLLLSLCCQRGSLSELLSPSIFVTALLPTLITKQQTHECRKRSNGIQKRQNSSKAIGMERNMSEISSSVLGKNELDNNNRNNSNDNNKGSDKDLIGWRSNLPRDRYASPILWETRAEWKAFMNQCERSDNGSEMTNGVTVVGDHLWEQVKLEALTQLSTEPEAGPQLYQNILSQGSLLEAIVSIVANEIQSELITATEIKQLFLDMLTDDDEEAIRCDVIAAATRSPSVELAVLAILFHTGLHTLVCYRVGHRLWKADRTGLAKYLQSTVSKHYSADIHPACSMGAGIYLCTAAGVVIGETATVGNDVSILHGVTLGGTGKELGDRHPKVQHGVILKDCATVLGNISVGTGAVIMAKAIVNKPVPPLAIMSGVPAKVIETRTLTREAFHDDLEDHLAFKYLDEWKELQQLQQQEKNSANTATGQLKN